MCKPILLTFVSFQNYPKQRDVSFQSAMRNRHRFCSEQYGIAPFLLLLKSSAQQLSIEIVVETVDFSHGNSVLTVTYLPRKEKLRFWEISQKKTYTNTLLNQLLLYSLMRQTLMCLGQDAKLVTFLVCFQFFKKNWTRVLQTKIKNKFLFQ